MSATTTRPAVGVIHATPLSLEPLTEAMAGAFPEARLRHLLDDSLLTDLRETGRLTAGLEARMERLVDHLVADGVDALQFACSGYVPVVDRVAARLPIPVRKPDEAMYRELATDAPQHVGVLATVQPALDLAVEQLEALLSGSETRISARCLPAAMDAAQVGDRAELADMLIAAVRELVDAGAEVVAFAQYSMSPVADEVAGATGATIVTGPTAAARDLRAALGA